MWRYVYETIFLSVILKVMFKFKVYKNWLSLWNAAKCYDAVKSMSVSYTDIRNFSFKWFF